MTAPDALDRLAAARPEVAGRTAEVLPPDERTELQRSIVTSPSSPFAQHRRRWAVLTAAAVVAAGTAAAVLVLAPFRSPDAAAAIVAKATTEIDGHTRGVFAFHSVQYGPDRVTIVSDGWWDLQDTRSFRIDINTLAQQDELGGYVQDGRAMRISVDSARRTALISHVQDPSLGVPHEPSVTQLKAQLRSGSLSVVGHQVVDGVRALHLRGPVNGHPIDLWIDPATYDIVRVQVSEKGERVVEDLRWLPPTPENLAMVKVTVPPGYLRIMVPTPPGTTRPNGGGAGGSSTSTTQPSPVRAVFVPTPPGSSAVLQQIASTMRARLHDLGDSDVTVTATGTSVEVSGRISPTDLRLVGTTGSFSVRPVLCGAPPYSPPGPGTSPVSGLLPACQAPFETTAANLAVNTATAQPANTVPPDPGFSTYPSTPPQDDDPSTTVLLPADPSTGTPCLPTVRARSGPARRLRRRLRAGAIPGRRGSLGHRHRAETERRRPMGRCRRAELPRLRCI